MSTIIYMIVNDNSDDDETCPNCGLVHSQIPIPGGTCAQCHKQARVLPIGPQASNICVTCVDLIDPVGNRERLSTLLETYRVISNTDVHGVES